MPEAKREKASSKAPARSTTTEEKPSLPKRTGKISVSGGTGRKSPASATKISSPSVVRKKIPATPIAKAGRKNTAGKTKATGPSGVKRQPRGKMSAVKGGKASSRPALKTSLIAGRKKLPEEYGDNEVILIPVDPNVIFVDWEIKKEEIPAVDTAVILRVIDVTPDHAAPQPPPERSRDFMLKGRVGSGFFDIGMPDRDVIVEVGHHRHGAFSPILTSSKVSMPPAAEELLEPEVPVGY
jgi:hypothetical protein